MWILGLKGLNQGSAVLHYKNYYYYFVRSLYTPPRLMGYFFLSINNKYLTNSDT